MKVDDAAVTRATERGSWLFGPANRVFTAWSLVGSYVTFLLFLHRWMVTDLGLLSFGRVWQYYITYTDFGFIRRGLIGTLLTVSGLNRVFANEYVFGFVFHTFAGAIIWIALYALLTRTGNLSRAVTLAVCFAPSILHFSVSTGNLDTLIYLFLLMIILCKDCLIAVVAFTLAGILTHELMLFCVPFVATLYNSQFAPRDPVKRVLFTIAPVAVALMSVATLGYFNATPINMDFYNQVMAAKLPNAFGKHAYWSGYFEVYSNFRDNFRQSMDFLPLLFIGLNAAYLIVPLLYVGFFIWLVLARQVAPLFWRLAQAGAIMFPLLIIFVGLDIPRWICLAANLGLLAVLLSIGTDQLVLSRRASVVMLLFCLLSPFGSADFRRPFPVHQFVLDKLIGKTLEHPHY